MERFIIFLIKKNSNFINNSDIPRIVARGTFLSTKILLTFKPKKKKCMKRFQFPIFLIILIFPIIGNVILKKFPQTIQTSSPQPKNSNHNKRLTKKTFERIPTSASSFSKWRLLSVPDTLDRGLLKAGNWIPIFLTVAVCGTFACGAIGVFIVYRFMVEDVLDGNPVLTIALILANVFTLQTVLPFCVNDDYLGAERLNSRKILATTLAFGLDFSLMLTRAFFLVFSKGGVFTAHINGHLQGLMVFFMFFVQVAISVMFFALSTHDSAVVMRSLIFIALLGKK